MVRPTATVNIDSLWEVVCKKSISTRIAYAYVIPEGNVFGRALAMTHTAAS